MRADTLAPATFFDKELTGFSIDTRTVAPGELFFALAPEDYRRHYFTATKFDDGHAYLPQAFARGAAGAVVLRTRIEGDEELQALSDRLLLVDDVIDALQACARGVLEHWGGQDDGERLDGTRARARRPARVEDAEKLQQRVGAAAFDPANAHGRCAAHRLRRGRA